MKKLVLASALSSAALALASCSFAQSGETPPLVVTPGEPVELEESSPFAAEAHGNFAEPWAVKVHPETGTVFITEKAGTMKFYEPESGRLGTVTGLPEVAYEGQGGLGDLAFAPDFAESGMIYLSWAQSDGGNGTFATIGRGTLVCEVADECRIDNLQEIWHQSMAGGRRGHYSHRIVFSPDGAYMFVSSGDRQEQDPAQDLSNNLGAVVRLNLDGTPAAGNPFVDQGSPTDQIWSYGQRNLLGLAMREDGELWELEHGPAGGDELNFVVAGANYGWPTRSNGDNYNGVDIPDHTEDDGFTKPAIHWTPVIGPGGMDFYTGDMFADWEGQLLVAALTTRSIVHLSTDSANNSAEELGRYTFPTRLRDIEIASDGAIWVIEDGEDGRLLRLTPKG
ncbi:PQQ-dependent sugar dehydrogenase [Aurantiacibacter sp. D1-12]|uniref:PQQ-dependent sugar dehydrogenase n=1 Tax=Aurantiacibacter sp. D1-12 TaxID=2993658 RepID=UPI00237D2D2C|nr:PQQ-dependent sugar dehydrogenase [Aurantiacibacter sp. D1-12]MDE1466318.1 PQQ-dependent sugar dehydrogenase [Aurantiacibacter sp. D1-12]